MKQCIKGLYYTKHNIYPSLEKLLAVVISKAKNNTEDYIDLIKWMLHKKYEHLTALERMGYTNFYKEIFQSIYKDFVHGNQIIAVNQSGFGEIGDITVHSDCHLLLQRSDGSKFALVFQKSATMKILQKSSRVGLAIEDSIFAGKFFTVFKDVHEMILLSINPKAGNKKNPLKYIQVLRSQVNMKLAEKALKESKTDCYLCNKKQICKFQESINLIRGSEISEQNNNVSYWKMPKLNAEQEKVASIGKGIYRVNAGPGSGKTTTLVELGRRLLLKGYLGDDLFFGSFTNNGVQELKNRFLKMAEAAFSENPSLLDEAQRVTFLSYNGLGNKIAQKNLDDIYSTTPKLINRVDSLKILQNITEEYLVKYPVSGSYDTPFSVQNKGVCIQLLNKIEEMKRTIAESIAKGEEYVIPDDILPYYEEYEARKRTKNFIDYSDQLLILMKYLKAHKLPYKVIVIDEFQDSNQVHIHILKQMAEYVDALVVVGDDSQAIFSFNHVYPENMIHFDNYFKNVQDLYMTKNYRSCEQIIRASNTIIGYTNNRIPKTIIGTKPGGKIETVPIETPQDIVSFYKENILPEKRTLILCGNNAQAEKLSAAFMNQCVPVSLEYSILSDMLYALQNLISAIILKEKNYVPIALSILRLKEITEINQTEIENAYQRLLDISKHKNAYFELRKYFMNLAMFRANANPFDILDDSNINSIGSAFTYLRIYFESVTSERKSIISKDNSSGENSTIPVRISTFHNAKGSEYDVVMIDGTSLRSTNKTPITDEDFRLLYVGFTRAISELYLLLHTELSSTSNALEYYAYEAIVKSQKKKNKTA